MTLSVPTRATRSGGWCAKQFEVDAVDRLPHEQHAVGGGFVRNSRGDLDEGLAHFADRTFGYVVS